MQMSPDLILDAISLYIGSSDKLHKKLIHDFIKIVDDNANGVIGVAESLDATSQLYFDVLKTIVNEDVDKNDTHWHIFKAAAAAACSSGSLYWGGNVQPLSTTPSWTTLSGNTANSITLSSCCADISEGSITLTDSDSVLTTDINTVEE